jgi:hypothetical protein
MGVSSLLENEIKGWKMVEMSLVVLKVQFVEKFVKEYQDVV